VFEDKTVSEKHHVNAKRIGRPFYSLSTVSLPQLPERCLYLTCWSSTKEQISMCPLLRSPARGWLTRDYQVTSPRGEPRILLMAGLQYTATRLYQKHILRTSLEAMRILGHKHPATTDLWLEY